MYAEMPDSKDKAGSNALPLADFRSDTVTRPSAGMRAAMADAVVGDDVYDEDPTVHLLEETLAGLTGKEAGLYLASGTQSNLTALLTHCGRGVIGLFGNRETYNNRGIYKKSQSDPRRSLLR